MPTLNKKQDWAVAPYNVEQINNHYLVTNFFGSWDFLTRDEFKKLELLRLEETSLLFNRLYERGLILKDGNIAKAITEFRNLQSHLFMDTSLHIAVVTTRCNISCRYCQARSHNPSDMSYEVASKIIKYLFDVRTQNIHLEFQGGEPLLNWELVKFLIENVRKFNKTIQSLNIGMVTNGVLLDESKINFLIDNNVEICISLDGPKKIHNCNRVYNNGKGSYMEVIQAINRTRNVYNKRKIHNRPMNLLPTINKNSLSYAEEIIDEYVKRGAEQIALRPINNIGAAKDVWGKIGYSAEEFNNFWSEAMDYILALNLRGVNIKERIATVMLKKILNKENPGYVDLMNPCGAGRSVLTYMPNGDIYPCDEARMSESDMFKLGNVLKNEYEEIMKSPGLFSLCQSSLLDIWNYNCAYLPWMGTCPVINYLSQGNIVPKITQSELYKIHHFQFSYIFKKMLEDNKNRIIFERWVK